MNKIGSLWNKWDLHIHTDASDGSSSCLEILDEAKCKGIKCIAVTDHHTVDNVDIMKKLAKDKEISVISGVEFRTEYGRSSVHIIGLFPDYYNKQKLTSEYLKENVLNKLGLSRTKIIEKGKENNKKCSSDNEYFKEGMSKVQVDFREAADIIHKYGGLVVVHAGTKSNSIDEEMKHEGRELKNVSKEYSLGPVKEELFNEGYIDICEISNQNQASFYEDTFSKPSIIASDAHKAQDVGKKFCWIKADISFEGLKQIVIEHDRVSFSEPKIIGRIKDYPNKFIKSVNIRRTDSATMPEKWFEDVEIPLNPGLVAIIGNKGNGKSALADIIALCADTTNQDWSFLTSSKFRMATPYNRSKQIQASISWYDSKHSEIKTLDNNSDLTKPERVKYIPQNFLESICTSENSQLFEQELKKIVFQYLDETDKYKLNDFDSVVSYLTRQNEVSCNELKDTIKVLNAEIISLEEMFYPGYKCKLENELKYQQDQLDTLMSKKPKAVQPPNSDRSSIQESITECQRNLEVVEKELKNLNLQLETLVRSKQDLEQSLSELDRLSLYVKNIISNLNSLYKDNNLVIDNIISLQYNPQLIRSKINEYNNILCELQKKLDVNNTDSVQIKKIHLSQKLKQLKENLNKPEREYQSYLEELKIWETRYQAIIGTAEQVGSIKNLESQIYYINNNLYKDYLKKIKRRYECVQKLIYNKEKNLGIYNDLFKPISNFIQKYKNELADYPIEFKPTFIIKNFEDNFFDFINQQVSGSYYGREQGTVRVKNNIAKIDMSNTQTIADFACLTNSDLLFDKRDLVYNLHEISPQLKKGHSKLELYNFIYCLDYVKPFFQLMMNGKSLSLLSPGERCALLLLLYLFIDKDDNPLIIDQPEENLDNETVFKYLVKFIKEAKKKRQIIMVTHNPNLAVVCDAEQIVQMKIDKENKNIVSYVSGAIENYEINQIIVNILEGTYPAFHTRDSKYFNK